jgi:hypothetical protein
MDASEQLELELVRRVRPLALLGQHVVEEAIQRAMFDSPDWCDVLHGDDRQKAERAAAGIMDALYPDGPPLDWWTTPLGHLIASTGWDPGRSVSTREAGNLLGRSHTWAQRLRSPRGEIELRAVLDELETVGV